MGKSQDPKILYIHERMYLAAVLKSVSKSILSLSLSLSLSLKVIDYVKKA